MAVEHFIPEGPKPLPEHRRLQAKVQCAAQKQGEGGRETSALRSWGSGPNLLHSELCGVSHVHPEQAWTPGWKFYIQVSLQDVTGLSGSFCDLGLFFHWIRGPGQRWASSPTGHQLPYRATPPVTQAQLKVGGEAWLPVANMHIQ